MSWRLGIDVAKRSLEWAAGPEGKIQQVRNEPRPIARCVHQIVSLGPERIVVESTGGYERRLVAKLAAAGLPVVVVNPRRVRSFGEAMGLLAKTDAIDARLLALFGDKLRPPIRPILGGRERGVRRIRGGRASVRTVLYLAAMSAARFSPCCERSTSGYG